MKKFSDTEQRIAETLEQMRKAMPEIRRQVAVYEKSLKLGNKSKVREVTVHSRNV